MEEYIYVLELNGGNFYIGKTKDIARRFQEHKTQNGSAWTKKHGGCKLVELYTSSSLFDEDKYTMEYMNKIGIDNVRGGSYSNVILTDEQRNNITRSLRNANNLCMTCGESGHFSDTCSPSSSSYSYVYSNSSPISTSDSNSGLNFPHTRYLPPDGVLHNDLYSQKDQNTQMCGRCGRNSHNTYDCFAKTDLRGNSL